METPLAMMLWMDAQYAHPSALPDCLGDSYLYGLNPVCRGVRDRALALGVTYCSVAEPLGRDYAAAPLLVLPRILESGIIPYFPNVDLLRQLVAGHPNAKILAGELRLVKPNYLLHESAHVVADRALRPLGLDGAVHALLGESFANAVEALGNVYAVLKPHQAMYALNSYMAEASPPRLELLRALAAAYGFRKVFETALWIFFFLNVKPHTDDPGPRYLDFAACNVLGADAAADPLQRLLVSAGPRAFGLSKGFRENTTPVHFRLGGLEAEYQALAALDFESEALADFGIAPAIAALAKTAEPFGGDSSLRANVQQTV